MPSTNPDPRESAPRVYGIVPAAGRSRRMGRSKQLLEFNAKPMLSAVLDGLATTSINGIVVVTHDQIARSLDLSNRRDLIICFNNDAATEMIDSVRLGLLSWGEHVSLRAADGFLILPADQPGISPDDFEACLATFRRDPNRIIVASHLGRRGHPMIFPKCLSTFVHSIACDRGLQGLLERHSDMIETVSCRSPAVIRNINTPDEYNAIQ